MKKSGIWEDRVIPGCRFVWHFFSRSQIIQWFRFIKIVNNWNNSSSNSIKLFIVENSMILQCVKQSNAHNSKPPFRQAAGQSLHACMNEMINRVNGTFYSPQGDVIVDGISSISAMRSIRTFRYFFSRGSAFFQPDVIDGQKIPLFCFSWSVHSEPRILEPRGLVNLESSND